VILNAMLDTLLKHCQMVGYWME